MAKRHCRFGVNKNTGRCLKTKRSGLSGARRRRRRR
jgi:hypothetical protein